ncbi:hypothetical protein GCM10010191_78430 [Actinomadura vinacea]|uniref:Uncharacterized protein n=1 Tax=Actinomadura vinacea TaxID=115336 RepID=A0ABN3K597_9ACTN
MPVRLPPGTRVRYHGTLTDLHGEYIYDGICGCDETGNPADFSDGCDEDWPSRHQLAYDEPAGAYGRRVILHVRHHHFTPVAKTPATDREDPLVETDPRAPSGDAILIPVRDYPTVATNAGIRETDRTLMVIGRLVRVTIGRADYYRLAEVLAAAPGPAYPLITDEQVGLADRPHTITVERVDPVTARAAIPNHNPDELLGVLAVVARHHGRLAKVCLVEPDMWGVDAETTARSYADGYGARYVPAGVA